MALYLGNGKVVECAAGKGVIISNAPKSARQIVHFSCLPSNNSAAYNAASGGVWVKSGDSYKFKVGNSYLTNRFQNINGDIYYFNGNGLRVTGWKTIQGKKYCFTKEGKMYLRWKRINNKKYYFDPLTGYMHTGWEWVKEQKKWYYLSPDTIILCDDPAGRPSTERGTILTPTVRCSPVNIQSEASLIRSAQTACCSSKPNTSFGEMI